MQTPSDDDTPVSGVSMIGDDDEAGVEAIAGDTDDADLDDADLDDADLDAADLDAADLDVSADLYGDTDRWEWGTSDWLVCLGLLVASVLLVGMHVSAYRILSPIDELQHIDYVIKAGNLDIPVRNERVGFEAMAEAACRSVDAPDYVGPECGLDEYDPSTFQENGFNTAASQFPPYYLVTGLAARGLTEVGLVGSPVTAARMIGALWAGAAWSVIWYLMMLLGVRRRSAAAVVAVLITTPFTVFHAGATVNADVSLMLSGAVAMLATVQHEAGRLRWWWLPPIYVGVFFVEATNILAIAACAVYLVVRRGLDSSISWKQRLAPVMILPALLVLRLEVAGRVQDALFPAAKRPPPGDGPTRAPRFELHRTDGVSFDKVIAQLDATFTPVRNPYFSPPLRSQLTIASVQLVNWLLIALMFTAAFVVAANARAAWWARVTMAALLAAGPFYTFYFAAFSDQDFAAPARFALPLVPLMAVSAASAINGARVFWVTAVIAALSGLNTVAHLVAAL